MKKKKITNVRTQPPKRIFPKLDSKTILIITIVIYVVLAILLFDPKLSTGGDNARYLILAESILTGHGMHEIENPSSPPHTAVPPGFPMLLALALLAFGKNFIMIKFLILLLSVATLIITYLLFRHYLEQKYFIPLFLFATLPIYLEYSHWIFSEIPFLLFTVLSFLFFERALKNKSILYLIFCAIAVAISYYMRAAGLAFIIGFGIYLLWKRKFRWLIIFGGIITVLILPWFIRNYMVSKSNPYVDILFVRNPYDLQSGRINFTGFIQRIAENLKIYCGYALPKIFLPSFNNAGWLAFCGIVFTIIIIIGFFTEIGKKYPASAISLVVYSAMLVIRPSVWSGDRFLLPVLPILLFYLICGILWLEKKIRFTYFTTGTVGILVLLNLIALNPQIRTAINNNKAYLHGDKYAGYSDDWRRYFEAIDWIKTNIPEDKVIMARKTEFVYLLSGRKSLGYPFTEDANKVQEAISKCDYILLDNFYWTGTTHHYLLPVLQQNPEKYEVVFTTKQPEFFVLKIKKS
jgi:hypothetical protein